MEGISNPEKDCGIIGNLFQSMVNEMRGSTPLWEDFTYKSMKLHQSMKGTVVEIGKFLEAFQKVADMATSSKGATREIGSALTRLCMRHRSIESHLKVLTSSIMDNLVAPLQEKLEDWKKSVAQIDKDHAKESKKAKADIKRAASDTVRLKKKVMKGNTSSHGKSEMQQKLEIATSEVNGKYKKLEETEKNSLRQALIEERSRFCLFITCLKPFVDSEVKLLTEISHIDEIMNQLCLQASEPSVLPPSSEQVILDLKGVDSSAWNPNQGSPPSSPSSLGSRKSSMCSINSINSSNSSSSSKSHSPSHTLHKRTTSQSSGGLDDRDEGDCDSTPTTPSDSTPSASSTWNNWPNLPAGAQRSMDPARPHTISSAYERGHTRPALKPSLFEPPQETVEMRPKINRSNSQSSNSSTGSQNRPSATINKLQPVLPPHCAKPKVKVVAPPMLPPGAQPIYANMAELEGKKSISDDGESNMPTTAASLPVSQAAHNQSILDLEEAISAMDQCTAGLSDTSEEVTPRASLEVEPPRHKMQQDTSDELAKAIRELEASTAALNSAYDTDLAPSSESSQPVNGVCDSDSYTSKSSLQCSSGYGTMASTPASSEDAIASGDYVVATTGNVESDKYFTIPRSGEATSDNRTAFQHLRPASTAGIPISVSNLTRRNTVNSQKPPPPVRRTASVTGAAPAYVQKLRSPPRQMSVNDAGNNNQGEFNSEAQYAELQHIQQSIHGARTGPEQSAKQNHRPIPPNRTDQASTATVIQSLNAKFASLNSQYQESGEAAETGGATPRGSRPTPPAVRQKPVRSSIPPPPPEISQQQPQQIYQQQYQQHQQIYQQPQQQVYQQPQQQTYQHQQVYQQPQQVYQQQGSHEQQISQHPRPLQHVNSWHGQRPSTEHQGHYHQAKTENSLQQPLHNAPPTETDFPLPPTAEELQEMERIYSQPQNIRPQMPAPSQLRRHSEQPQSHHGNGPQASLLMELKRKVSLDNSEA